MLDPGLIWKILAGLTLLAVLAIYLYTIFFKPPGRKPPHTWLVVILLVCSLSSCTSSRFYGVAARPESYGGGYVLVGEKCTAGHCEPAWYLCSPEVGGKILCGPVPIEWW